MDRKLFALVDCNNFYASCERVFRPTLKGKPVVVLSNNDGCVIARSEEAKALGIRMGHPLFECRPIIRKHGVQVFSSDVYFLNHIPAKIEWPEVAIITAWSLMASFLFTLPPALQASSLDPVEALRYE